MRFNTDSHIRFTFSLDKGIYVTILKIIIPIIIFATLCACILHVAGVL